MMEPPEPYHYYATTEDDRSAAGDTYSTTSGGSRSWIRHLDARFGGPMLFPYPILGGYSVAPGIHSSGPSSIANRTHDSIGKQTQPAVFPTTTPTEQALESLNQTTDKDGQTHGIPSPSTSSTTSKGLVPPQLQIKGLTLQISLYQKLGSLESACQLHQRKADLALQLGDTESAKQSLESVVSLRTADYAKDSTTSTAGALAQAHCVLADFWRDYFFHWNNAMNHYRAALAMWDVAGESCRLQVAECLFQMGQVMGLCMIPEGGTTGSKQEQEVNNHPRDSSLKYLQDAESICKLLEQTEGEEHQSRVHCLRGKILVAMGDAYEQAGDSDRAMACYRGGVKLGEDPEAALEALVAMVPT